MIRPTGCSGGVIHASHEYGIWIATCRHCVSRPGRAVDLKFFKDGYTSQSFRGYCLASHPRYDCSIVVIPPGTYNYPELPSVVPLSASGAYVGETVIAVGSYAGGTVAPAARKVYVTNVANYTLRLSDSAWGGHSGGAVVSAESMELVGVLWGAGHGYSSVTTSRAIIETLQLAAGRGQAMASIPAEVPEEIQVSVQRPVIEVSGSVSARSQWYAELLSDPRMSRFDWQQGTSSKRLRFTWLNSTGMDRYVDGWPGYDRFVGRMLKCRGFPQDVPDSVQWGPRIGGGRSPQSPWTIPPNIIGGGVDQRDAEIKRLTELVEELISKARTAAQLVEDEARRLRLAAEDEIRQLRLEADDNARRLKNEFDESVETFNYNAAHPPPLPPSDDHPLNVAADWIQDSRDRDEKLVEFVTSVSPDNRPQQPDQDNGELPPWLPWAITAGVTGIVGGSAYRGRKKSINDK